MIQLTDKHYAVEVPEDARHIKLHNYDTYSKIVFSSAMQDPFNCGGDMITMERGNWQFLFTTKGCTEEQAASVVQLISNGKISGRPQYRRYDRDPIKDMPAKCWTRDSRHSLETLLLSKGCDINRNQAIIQKQKDNAALQNNSQ